MEGITGIVQLTAAFVVAIAIPLGLGACCLIPIGLLIQEKKRRHRENKHPFDDPIPRAPGQWILQQIDNHSEKGFIAFAGPLFIVVAGVPWAAGQQGDARMNAVYGFLAVFAFSLITSFFYLRAWGRQQWKYTLGLDGERYVAHQLERLKPYGYKVYHDLPFKNYNIDHVVIGEGGLFVIETKTRRKKRASKNSHQYRAKFDGERIDWEGETDSKPVEQAIRNAKSLAQYLSKETGETVWAHPIVAIPGWYVTTSRLNPKVSVVNAKGVEAVVRSIKNPIEAAQLRRMEHQLEKLSYREVA